ncbi:MAG TPA: dihydrofolate reductase family protein, partial [Flavitalea sp.]|nr:dihydrofolate reductase family protein [Flavitalea sp.]
DNNVEFFSDVQKLIAGLREKDGKNIYCDCGGELVFELLKYSLIDTLVIPVIQFLVGEGTRLFKKRQARTKTGA